MRAMTPLVDDYTAFIAKARIRLSTHADERERREWLKALERQLQALNRTLAGHFLQVMQ
jgi:hypothetical protein